MFRHSCELYAMHTQSIASGSRDRDCSDIMTLSVCTRRCLSRSHLVHMPLTGQVTKTKSDINQKTRIRGRTDCPRL